jgi:hypothetical protein
MRQPDVRQPLPPHEEPPFASGVHRTVQRVHRTVQRARRSVRPSIPLTMAVLALAFGATAVTASCLGDLSTATVTTACVPFDPADTADPFVLVSGVLEKRCGSLDCHGGLARPLRIYGNAGLRRPEPDLGTEDCNTGDDCGALRTCEEGNGCLDAKIYDYAEYYSGGSINTTPTERLENWRSICGLEPELMTVVYCCSAGEGVCNGFNYAASCADEANYDPVRLTLVRKARLREKHKGAQIWGSGDAGDKCLTNWLTGAYENDPGLLNFCIEELKKL